MAGLEIARVEFRRRRDEVHEGNEGADASAGDDDLLSRRSEVGQQEPLHQMLDHQMLDLHTKFSIFLHFQHVVLSRFI